MFKYKSFLILFISLLVSFCGCDRSNVQENKKKTSIVVTTVPLYDWAKSIVGSASNDVDITVLQDSGVDLHDYQPTAKDIIIIGKADIFIFVGGQSDNWVPNVLSQVKNTNRKNINALSLVKDMMHKNCHSKCNHHHDHHHDHDLHTLPDEHIWLSLRFAKKVCDEIAHSLIHVYPNEKDIFIANLEKYNAKLTKLDTSFSQYVSNAKNKSVIIADRFPFAHFFSDYGLTHFAAFEGCTAEADASFQTIMHLSQKLKTLNLPTIYTLEGGGDKIAKRIIEMSKQDKTAIKKLNSMQNTPLDKFTKLGGYIEIMKSNIAALKETIK